MIRKRQDRLFFAASMDYDTEKERSVPFVTAGDRRKNEE